VAIIATGVAMAAAKIIVPMKRYEKRIFFSSKLALRSQCCFGRNAGNLLGPEAMVSVVYELDIGGSIMGVWKAGVCALLHVFSRLQFAVR
jgi:hypothetical protein